MFDAAMNSVASEIDSIATTPYAMETIVALSDDEEEEEFSLKSPPTTETASPASESETSVFKYASFSSVTTAAAPSASMTSMCSATTAKSGNFGKSPSPPSTSPSTPISINASTYPSTSKQQEFKSAGPPSTSKQAGYDVIAKSPQININNNSGRIFASVNSASSYTQIAKQKCYPASDSATYKENAKKLYNEIKILSKISHPHIIKFYGFSAFQGIAVMTEYLEGGSLHAMIHDDEEYKKNLHEFNRLRILYQISDALIYLKSRAIVHRKIEPKTILLTANLDAKLSNFSYSDRHTVEMMKAQNNSKSIFFYKLLWPKKYKNEELAEMEFPMSNLPENVLEKILKESPYISPETAVNHVFSCQSDLWQFAMTIYELYSQKQPFHFSAGPMYKLHNLICTVSIWKNLPKGTDEGIVGIFKKCTAKSGNDRMRIEQVKEKLHNLLIIKMNESRG